MRTLRDEEPGGWSIAARKMAESHFDETIGPPPSGFIPQMNRCLIIVFFLVTAGAVAQQKPFEALREVLKETKFEGLQDFEGKCGTPVIFDIRRRMAGFPETIRMTVAQILQRPTLHTNRLSPSGRFRIHYDTAGVNLPQMIAGVPLNPVPNSREEYVDSVGAIFDRCWEMEVEEMQFRPPPSDAGSGGGTEYDIYIRSQSPDLFGFTSWDGEAQLEGGGRDRYVTFIEIDNDFFSQRTKGLDGLRVTAAHEFHHALQIGSYGIWNTVPNSDFYFYELSSVWMEEVVYDGVNDYYFDVGQFLQNFKDGSARSFSFTAYTLSNAGYERSIWNQYLEKRFGRDIVRQIWEGMLSQPALTSMDRILKSHGSSLRSAFGEFASWNMFTGTRSDTLRYYPEGGNFPAIQPNTTVAFNGSSTFVQGEAYPLSAQYYAFVVAGDTIMSGIANVDHVGAYGSPGERAALRLTLSQSVEARAVQKLTNGLTMGFDAEPIDDWRTLYISTASESNLISRMLPSPNPLRVQEATALVLPAEGSLAGNASVFLLTASFDLVFSGSYPISDLFGKQFVSVPTRDFAGNVSTGIHFVFLKTGQREYRWKMAIIR